MLHTGIAWNDNSKMSYPRWSIPCGRPVQGGTCPCATPECLKTCYGNRCYVVDGPKEQKDFRPSVRQHDLENLDFTKREDFVPRMVDALRAKRPAIVRIHERGDFYTLQYFRDWCRIAEACPETRFFSFTKCFHLFTQKRPINFTLIASMFYDEKRKRPAQAPAFYTVPKGQQGPGNHCHGGCDACGICPYATARTTVWSEVH